MIPTRTVLTPILLLLLLTTSMCGKKRPVISAPPPAALPESTTTPSSENASIGPVEAEKPVLVENTTSEDVPPPEIPEEPPVLSPLVEGDRAFLAGDYGNATSSYGRYLEENPESVAQTRVLFRLGVCLAMGTEGRPGEERAKEYFDRVIALSPESPYAIQSKLILELFGQLESLAGRTRQDREEIGRLKDQLEKLKSIDLSRRPPG